MGVGALMAIKVTVEAPRGAGKSHLIRALVPALQGLGYGVTAFYSDRSIDDLPTRGGQRVVIIEVDETQDEDLDA